MMEQNTNKLLEKAANARLVHLNSQLVFPILQKKIDEKIAALCETFKDKGDIRMADVAYIAAARDLVTELNQIARHGDRASEKLNLNPPI